MNNVIHSFIHQLTSVKNPSFTSLELKQFAGIFFLYVHGMHDRYEFERFLQKQADYFVRNTVLKLEFEYIRQSQNKTVYRIQLRVPEEKSFCCGNGCQNCILFTSHFN